jgi:hypothetical protein
MSITLSALQQQRRDTAANWTSANPTLLAGEIGVETDTGLLKIGDGSTAWTSLDYLPLSFEGYAANGIYNPAANQVALATNGTGRLFIDSSGNVGIGTSSPNNQLHLVGSSASNYLRIDGSTGNRAFLGVESGAAVIYAQDNSGGNAPITFNTGSSERMRIDSSGRLLVGTTTEGHGNADNLTLADSGSCGLTLRSATDNFGRIYFSDGTSGDAEYRGIIQYDHTNNRMQFAANASTAMTVDSSGNVGIGTSSPAEKFDIVFDADSGLKFGTVPGSAGTLVTSYQGTNNSNVRQLQFDVQDFVVNTGLPTGTSTTERMRIDSSGRVGIGTTSPDSGLHIVKDTNPVLKIDRGANNTANFNLYYNGTLRGQIGGASNSFQLSAAGSTAPMEFYTDGSQRMLINSSGRVGIGTSSPTDLLHIRDAGTNADTAIKIGNDSRDWVIENSGSNSDSFKIYNDLSSNIFNITTGGNVGIGTSSPNHLLTLDKNSGACFIETAGEGYTPGTNSVYYGQDTAGEGYFWNRGNNDLLFGTNNTERMRIDSDGKLLVGYTSSSSVLGNGVGVKSNAVGSAYNTGALSLSGTGGDFYGLTFNKTGASSDEGFGFLAVFSGATDYCIFGYNDGTTNQTIFTAYENGDFDVQGALSKGSGSFKIDHPLPEKTATHYLVHSFIEGPQADLIYRGKIDLAAGRATVNLDTAARMTEGTFVLLNTNVQCFTTNESDWTQVKGSVSGNVLTIEAQDNTSTATVSWLVIGERKDQHMIETRWTDANGRVITEPEKPVEA